VPATFGQDAFKGEEKSLTVHGVQAFAALG